MKFEMQMGADVFIASLTLVTFGDIVFDSFYLFWALYCARLLVVFGGAYENTLPETVAFFYSTGAPCDCPAF